MAKIIRGYHGTNSSNVTDILTNNFNLSVGRDHWLGNGVYFFLEGINDPKELAKEWATAESWDNDRKCRAFYEYSVLESEIICESNMVLDLTSLSGLRIFNDYRDRHKKQVAKERLKAEVTDWQILELLKKSLGIEIIIASVYIKFTLERIHFLESRIPNCAIMCVSNPKKIRQESIKDIERGGIENVF